MDAPSELMERAKELVRSLCARNLIPGADLGKVTVAIHDELCAASLAIIAEIGLRRDSTCRGNIEIALKGTGFELMDFLHSRRKSQLAEQESDPAMKPRTFNSAVKALEPSI